MVNKYQSKLFSLCIIIITFLAYSCAPTYAPVYPEPVNIKTIIKTGDTVIVTTKDGNEYEFEVVEITDEAIVGESDKVLFTDMHKLQKMTITSNENSAKAIIAVPLIIIFGAAQGI